MTKLTKLMTLIPLVALGAACNGAAPTAPDSVSAPEMGSAYGSEKAIGPNPCSGISGVTLKLMASPSQSTLIQASYTSFGSVGRCAAPVWTSVPDGALISDTNPFKTRVNPAFKSVTVFATAPNGVQGRIHIGLSTEAAAASCKDITGVSLKQILLPQAGTTLIQSSYTSFGSIRGCPAPVWTSVPANALINDANPFRIRVSPLFKFVTVYATAANGVQGSITIGSRAEAVGCKNITAVELKLVLVPQRGTVIKASYVALGGLDTRCAAPVWASNPKGALVNDTNPFKTRIAPGFTQVTVFATAPNGVQGQMVIGR